MAFIKTTTPTYKDQTTNGAVARPPNVMDWLMGLFRTPTPTYKIAPPPPPPSESTPPAHGDDKSGGKQ